MDFTTIRRSTAKVIRTLGIFGLMMALAGLLATSVRPASAASIVPGTSLGKVSISVVTDPSPSVVNAEVVIRSSDGNVVAKAVVSNAASSSYIATLAVGAYKVYVNAAGYSEYVEIIKIGAGEATVVKATLSATPSATVDPIVPAPVPAQLAKVNVSVQFGPSPTSTTEAKVIVADGNGNVVASGITKSGSFAAVIAAGVYKVYITAPNFKEYSELIKVGGGETASVKALLSPR